MKSGFPAKSFLVATVLLFSLLLFETPGVAKTNKNVSSSGLNMAVVRMVVRSQLQEVQKCYTDLIIEGMAAKGKVVATWQINDQGKVQNIQIVENTSKDPALEGCVTERVINWVFPAADPGTSFEVSYPFQFGR